jgi:tRNA (Thr-GGU) A37 N-methylase
VSDPTGDQVPAAPADGDDGRFEVRAVAWVRSGRTEPVDDGWDDVATRIELASGVDPRSLDGIEGFSHLEVLYVFDRVHPAAPMPMRRRPRGNPMWPEVGLFAQRNKDRPNRLGLSVCRLVARDGATLHVQGLDAIDGTPVLDLKPWFGAFGPRGAVRQPAWVDELLADYF